MPNALIYLKAGAKTNGESSQYKADKFNVDRLNRGGGGTLRLSCRNVSDGKYPSGNITLELEARSYPAFPDSFDDYLPL